MLPSYRTKEKAVKVKTAKTKSGCGCPPDECNCGVCAELQNLDHPRHFAGQLLTEAELNGTLDYVKAKNRLHNRYLHGWGVVCGLQVSCNECDGWVTVHPGYAIDPCGNDIIVAETQDVNLLEMIRACKEASRKRNRNCDPIHPNGKADCKEGEEHWCLTVAYDEQPCKPVVPLRNEKKACACGNGNGSKQNGSCGCSTTVATAYTAPLACEPARVCETYKWEVVVEPECCRHEWPPLPQIGRQPGSDTAAGNTVGTLGTQMAYVLAYLLQLTRQADLSDTLLVRVSACIRDMWQFLYERIGAKYVVVLTAVLSNKTNNSTITPQDYQVALQRLYQAVYELYARNPFNVRCATLQAFGYIPKYVELGDLSSNVYLQQVTTSVYSLLALIVQYAIDCVCQNLLPPCPENPCDDRVILACVTLKDGKITSICDFGCRRYAGSFPARDYWWSAIPIVPILKVLVDLICCTDLLSLIRPRDQGVRGTRGRVGATPHTFTTAPGTGGQPGGEPAPQPEEVEVKPGIVDAGPFNNSLVNLVNAIDPDGTLRQAILGDNFAQPRRVIKTVRERLADRPLPDVSAVSREGVRLTGLVDKSPEMARTALKEGGVNAVQRTVTSREQLARVRLTASFAAQGDTVVLYTLNDKVAGFALYDAEEKLVDKQAELDALRSDVSTLRRDLDDLKNPRPPKAEEPPERPAPAPERPPRRQQRRKGSGGGGY